LIKPVLHAVAGDAQPSNHQPVMSTTYQAFAPIAARPWGAALPSSIAGLQEVVVLRDRRHQAIAPPG
jgi:hypothetical protein